MLFKWLQWLLTYSKFNIVWTWYLTYEWNCNENQWAFTLKISSLQYVKLFSQSPPHKKKNKWQSWWCRQPLCWLLCLPSTCYFQASLMLDAWEIHMFSLELLYKLTMSVHTWYLPAKHSKHSEQLVLLIISYLLWYFPTPLTVTHCAVATDAIIEMIFNPMFEPVQIGAHCDHDIKKLERKLVNGHTWKQSLVQSWTDHSQVCYHNSCKCKGMFEFGVEMSELHWLNKLQYLILKIFFDIFTAHAAVAHMWQGPDPWHCCPTPNVPKQWQSNVHVQG